jgi:hypothetical protein
LRKFHYCRTEDLGVMKRVEGMAAARATQDHVPNFPFISIQGSSYRNNIEMSTAFTLERCKRCPVWVGVQAGPHGFGQTIDFTCTRHQKQ